MLSSVVFDEAAGITKNLNLGVFCFLILFTTLSQLRKTNTIDREIINTKAEMGPL